MAIVPSERKANALTKAREKEKSALVFACIGGAVFGIVLGPVSIGMALSARKQIAAAGQQPGIASLLAIVIGTLATVGWASQLLLFLTA